jgi:hypothetical protein
MRVGHLVREMEGQVPHRRSALVARGFGVDRRTVLLAGVAALPVFLVLVALGAPRGALLVVPVVSGALAGAVSDNFEGEWMDGSAAAVVGLAGCYAATMALLWLRTAGMAPVARENLLVYTGTVLAVVGTLFLVPVVAVLGAGAALVVAGRRS